MDCIRTHLVMEVCKMQNQLVVRVCITKHVFQFSGCARNTQQSVTAMSNLKLFHMAQV